MEERMERLERSRSNQGALDTPPESGEEDEENLDPKTLDYSGYVLKDLCEPNWDEQPEGAKLQFEDNAYPKIRDLKPEDMELWGSWRGKVFVKATQGKAGWPLWAHRFGRRPRKRAARLALRTCCRPVRRRVCGPRRACHPRSKFRHSACTAGRLRQRSLRLPCGGPPQGPRGPRPRPSQRGWGAPWQSSVARIRRQALRGPP